MATLAPDTPSPAIPPPRSANRRSGLVARLRHVLRERDGTAAIEFAVVLPALLLLTFAILQFGTMLVVHHSMDDAARHAARGLAVGEMTMAEAVTAANSLLVDWPSNWRVTAEDAATTGTPNVRVHITVPASEAALFGYVPLSNDLVAEVVMREA